MIMSLSFPFWQQMGGVLMIGYIIIFWLFLSYHSGAKMSM